MSDLLVSAMEFAIERHGAQLRKYTNTPYWLHLAEVAGMVSAATSSDRDMVAAAWLHDTLEDTSASAEDIESLFGREVTRLVAGVTDVSTAADGSRAQRKRLDREHVAQGCWKIHTIKLADIISNSISIVMFDPKFAAVYLPEKRALLDVLGKGDKVLRERAITILTAAECSLEQAQRV